MQWFKHQSSATSDAKIRKLIIKHGPIGYAVYFHCLELITGDFSEQNLTFELEHDSEIIADNLKIKGTAEKSGVEIVEDVMRYIVSLDLFTESSGRIRCFKLIKNMDASMTSNPRFREMITSAKKNHDSVMISHDSVMQEETRRDLNRREDKSASSDANNPVRHKHGEYSNVLLTDSDLEKLKSEFPLDWKERITRLDDYIQSKGAKYKDHLATIRAWARKDVSRSVKAVETVDDSWRCFDPLEDRL